MQKKKCFSKAFSDMLKYNDSERKIGGLHPNRKIKFRKNFFHENFITYGTEGTKSDE